MIKKYDVHIQSNNTYSKASVGVGCYEPKTVPSIATQNVQYKKTVHREED